MGSEGWRAVGQHEATRTCGAEARPVGVQQWAADIAILRSFGRRSHFSRFLDADFWRQARLSV